MKINKNLLKFFFIFTSIFLQSCGNDDSLPPDTTPPSDITLVLNDLSGNNSTEAIRVSNILEIKVDATDDRGISKVEAFIDNQKVNEDSTAPFKIEVDVTPFETGEYLLKVTASDAAGNMTSKEEPIFIDNTMPSITNISIENNTVINGDETPLTFEVTDDEEIENVIVFINDIAKTEITDGNYETVINTSDLQDGNNIIKIIATDLTGNVSTVIQNFIVDNTGPEIKINTLVEGQIIDEVFSFNPELTDAFSEVTSLEVFYNNQQIKLFENTLDYKFEFDPENYPVGNGVFKFIAIDYLGNQTESIANIEILRALLRLEFPSDFVDEAIEIFWVYASKPDGTNIVAKQIEGSITETVLHAPGEFNITDEFMVTFYSLDNGGFSRISTFQNLTRFLPEQMILSKSEQKSIVSSNSLESKGFFETDSPIVFSEGQDYRGSLQENPIYHIEFYAPERTNNVYFYSYDFPSNDGTAYKYQKVNTPIVNDFVLDIANFDTPNVEFKSFDAFSAENVSIKILGFESVDDFNNNVFHEIYRNYGIPNLTSSTIGYPLINSFHSYRHEIAIGDYITERSGSPLASYIRPEWSIDFNLINNQKISFVTTGTSHTVGKVSLGDSGNNPKFVWNLIFDSQKTTEVVIPSLPTELENTNFYNFVQTNTLEVALAELSLYEGISSYPEYLNQVIKYKKDYYEESDYVEAINKAGFTPGGYRLEDFFF
ncbi:hypothetical protein J9332_11450 [Aquimarina celericrescens]|nr:hypothetical protein [Aquimarina celericrescens]